MFYKIIKTVQTVLLAALVCVVGWYCWTRRDADRFTFHENQMGAVSVLDTRTGAVYIMHTGQPNGGWFETHPQTGHSVLRELRK